MGNFIKDRWIIKIIISVIASLIMPTAICPLLVDTEGNSAPCYRAGTLLGIEPILGIAHYIFYIVVIYLILSAIFHFYRKSFGKN